MTLLETSQTLLQQLEEELARLTVARDQVAQTVRALTGMAQPLAGMDAITTTPPARLPTPKGVGERRGTPFTRAAALEAFIAKNGPSTRNEIIRGLPDMPLGTLGYLLSQSTKFVRDKEGRWHLK